VYIYISILREETMTYFEKFLEGIRVTTEEKFPFVFKVKRNFSDELKAHMKIEGLTDEQINERKVLVPGNEMKKLAHEKNPEIRDFLELVFYWGQNDFQPVKGSPSVSVGDVIEFLDKEYKVEPVGFKEL
jgi:hypothetical protein